MRLHIHLSSIKYLFDWHCCWFNTRFGSCRLRNRNLNWIAIRQRRQFRTEYFVEVVSRQLL